jgi:hypothetical protein
LIWLAFNQKKKDEKIEITESDLKNLKRSHFSYEKKCICFENDGQGEEVSNEQEIRFIDFRFAIWSV